MELYSVRNIDGLKADDREPIATVEASTPYSPAELARGLKLTERDILALPCVEVWPGGEPYEWRQAPDKQPYFIRAANSDVTTMAGLWEEWKDNLTGEHRKSCAIITTTPNEAMAVLPHDRMPVVLDEADCLESYRAILMSTLDIKALCGPLGAMAGEQARWQHQKQ